VEIKSEGGRRTKDIKQTKLSVEGADFGRRMVSIAVCYNDPAGQTISPNGGMIV
jgi:hypothetical protein